MEQAEKGEGAEKSELGTEEHEELVGNWEKGRDVPE